MSDVFLHGIEVIEGKPKPAPLKLSNQGVIGIIGTADDVLEGKFPLDTPVLIAGSEEEAAGLGDTGSLPKALKCIFGQCHPQIIVVRVDASGEGEADVLNSILGGYDAETDTYSGVHVFKVAKSLLGITPKVLIAPGFASKTAVANELAGIADVLGATVVLDGPNTSDADVVKFAGEFKSRGNVYVIDPFLKVAKVNGFEEVPGSPYVAAVMAGQSYAESPSNVVIKGVSGTSREVDFRHGDANCRANLLNKSSVGTVIREDGFRVWGNQATSGAFLSSYRIKDYMTEGLRSIFFPHVDRGLTVAKVDYLLLRANEFLGSMVRDSALVRGVASAPAEKNTAADRRNGRLTIAVDYEDVTPMERVTIELNYEQGE